MIVPITKVQLRQDEDGVWIAKSSLLPGCHAHGRDRGEATLRFQQAAKEHLEALLETGRSIPEAFRDKFVLAAWPWGNTLHGIAANWNVACARLVANLFAPPAAIGIIQIHFVPTGSSLLHGIRAMCRAALLATSLKTSVSAATTFTSRNFKLFPRSCRRQRADAFANSQRDIIQCAGGV